MRNSICKSKRKEKKKKKKKKNSQIKDIHLTSIKTCPSLTILNHKSKNSLPRDQISQLKSNTNLKLIYMHSLCYKLNAKFIYYKQTLQMKRNNKKVYVTHTI